MRLEDYFVAVDRQNTGRLLVHGEGPAGRREWGTLQNSPEAEEGRARNYGAPFSLIQEDTVEQTAKSVPARS